MAMFNVLASLDNTDDISDILISLSESPRSIITVFPVVSSGLQSFNGIGITVSSKDIEKLFQIKEELIAILYFLWEKNFVIRELYNGKVLTKESFKRDLYYFWDLSYGI